MCYLAVKLFEIWHCGWHKQDSVVSSLLWNWTQRHNDASNNHWQYCAFLLTRQEALRLRASEGNIGENWRCFCVKCQSMGPI